MLEKVLDLKKSMFLTDTSEDIDANLRYIASKKTSMFFEVDTPTSITKNFNSIYIFTFNTYCRPSWVQILFLGYDLNVP